jgi:multidrug resistance protein MdtO
MGTLAQTVAESRPPLPWYWEFLKEELAPYPGRAEAVARMVIAATLVMVICMTFRISYAYQGAIFALLVSREDLRATLQSAGALLLVTVVSTAYLLISAWFVISFPVLHFLWIIVSFFVVFYVLSTMSNYGVAAPCAFIISLGVPLWDRHLSAERNVEDTLRVVLASSIGVVVTAAVELTLARMKPGDNVVLPITERLAAVESVLACYIEGHPVDRATEQKITRLGMRGTSILRRILRRSDYSPHYRAQMGGVVALVGWLVDIAEASTQLSFKFSDDDQKQLRELAAIVASIRTDLINRRTPDSIQFGPDNERSGGVPLLREMEKIVTQIPQVFAGSRSIDEYLPPADDMPGPKLFVADALTSPEHLEFAAKGCLAASLCYIIYNSIAWPGVSTAVTTCMLTALSTIGSSRQKQVLRFSGALVGGFLIGMGSQVFILPYLDSIAGFTVLFILVTAFSSWFMTSSPRLSYFGLQVALAFYLINLQEFAIQTSLSIARDRVVGVLLGLILMWFVFDQLWAVPAGVEMKRTFVSGLRLLAELARGPLPGREKSWSDDTLRETISTNFDKVRSLADGVLFELGPSRQQDLALRSRIRQWQPQLRTLFLTQVALLKYRLQLPGFELPEAARAAEREFDDRLAMVLNDMANRLEGKTSREQEKFEDPFERLEQTIRSCCSEGPRKVLTAELQTFLALCRSAESLTISVNKEI